MPELTTPGAPMPQHQCRMRTSARPRPRHSNCPRSWLPLWLFDGCEGVSLVSCGLACLGSCCTGGLLSEKLGCLLAAAGKRLQATVCMLPPSQAPGLFGDWFGSGLPALALDVRLLFRLPRLPRVSSASCLAPFVLLLPLLPCSVQQYSHMMIEGLSEIG